MQSVDISIVLPEKTEVYYPKGADSTEISSRASYKIYAPIDVSCSTCLLKFKYWDDYYAEIREYNNTELIPVCSSKDNFESLKYWFENDKIYKISVPVLLDTENKFRVLNSGLFEETKDIAILTDADNRILYVGSPLENQQDKKIFLEYLKSSK
ncbi:hypothetical protein FQZ97_1005250 [compost metagenome]